jgi:hypothetical protein
MERSDKYVRAMRGRELEPVGWTCQTTDGEVVRIVEKESYPSGDVLIAEDGRRFRPARIGGLELIAEPE